MTTYNYPNQKWVLDTHRIGLTTPKITDLTQQFPIGTIAEYHDPSLGEATFIYLACSQNNTVAGSLLFYNQLTSTTIVAVQGGSVVKGQIAVAPVAAPASVNASAPYYYGWFQVGGAAPVQSSVNTANNIAANANLY